MWCIVGHYHDLYGYDEDYDEIVALFTTKQKAESYLVKAKLKHYSSHRWNPQFRASSLLAVYRSASIQKYEEASYIIDPEL